MENEFSGGDRGERVEGDKALETQFHGGHVPPGST